MLINLLFTDFFVFIAIILSIIVSITVHEFFHAYTAYKLGDSTPYNQGRVNLNPMSHVDPLGLLTLVLVGFGWGRPVEFDIYNLRHPKRDVLLIALSGPMSNFVLAFLFYLYGAVFGFNLFTQTLVQINLVLGVFNLIPVHPLDGFNVVRGLLPYNLAYRWGDLERYGFYILLGLILTGTTSRIIDPIVKSILYLFNTLI